MARMGVFSRNDSTPESVPRSLQLLTHRNTLDARYMEIYPNFCEILYPNESISFKVTNFVRSFPMKRPQLSRVRVVQRFAAIPIRLLWQAWEDYIKGENDAQFLLEEPYIVNATNDGSSHNYDSTNGAWSSATNAGQSVGITGAFGVGIDGGNVHLTSWSTGNIALVVSSPCSATDSTSGQRNRGIVCNKDGYPHDFYEPPVFGTALTDANNSLYAYAKFGVHELGDYLGAPLYKSLGKVSVNGQIRSAPFSAFKFAAYQLMYSYFDRSPNVQTRIDDFYEMSLHSLNDSSFEYPSVVSATKNYSNTSVKPISFVPPHEYGSQEVYPDNSHLWLDTPRISQIKTLSNGVVTAWDNKRDVAANNNPSDSHYQQDVIRSSWENVEKFPLKSGANMSMLACFNDPQTGLPKFVPSTISLFRMRFANWQTDYFTSCNPWQQRGDEAQIPVSGSVAVSIDGVTFSLSGATVSIPKTRVNMDLLGTGGSAVGVASYVNPYQLDNSLGDNNLAMFDKIYGAPIVYETGKTHDDITSANLVVPSLSASISQSATSTASGTATAVPSLFVSPSNFRFAMTLQHIKEMQAQIDNRYQSYIHKFFGARARDYRLDRPEFLGGSVMELNVSDVNQTSESSSSSPLGDVAGKSVSADTSRTIRYHADEHCIIMGTVHIIPDTEYVDGLSRIDSTRDRFDWALPQFSHLSEQAVYNEELVYKDIFESVSSDSGNRSAFGYEPVLNHLRWRPNRASGTFRDVRNATGNYEEYKPWLCVRDFGQVVSNNGFVTPNVPTLSDKFLSGRYGRDNSNFDIVDDGILYPFMLDSYFTERIVRTISSRGNPTRLGA